jgi:hypothetical protein
MATAASNSKSTSSTTSKAKAPASKPAGMRTMSALMHGKVATAGALKAKRNEK